MNRMVEQLCVVTPALSDLSNEICDLEVERQSEYQDRSLEGDSGRPRELY